MLLYRRHPGNLPGMKTTNPKATKTVYPVICQIVNTLLTHFIPPRETRSRCRTSLEFVLRDLQQLATAEGRLVGENAAERRVETQRNVDDRTAFE